MKGEIRLSGRAGASLYSASVLETEEGHSSRQLCSVFAPAEVPQEGWFGAVPSKGDLGVSTIIYILTCLPTPISVPSLPLYMFLVSLMPETFLGSAGPSVAVIST